MSIYDQFKTTFQGITGFGAKSYERALAAGYSHSEISQALSGGTEDGSSGKTVGRRAQGMAIQGVQAERDKKELEDQIEKYASDVAELKSQYSAALAGTEAAEAKASEFEDQLSAKTDEFDQLQQEADVYREQAVGQQLAGLRSGASSGGSNQTGALGGTLASGEPNLSGRSGSDASSLADIARSEGGLTDSVLTSSKGPVVEKIEKRQTSYQSGAPSSLTGGSADYYSNRFS